MSKAKAKKSEQATALKVGTRVRCTEDGIVGKIIWASGVSVKIQWQDGEQVTWKRDSLATRPVEFLEADAEPTEVTQSTTAQITTEPAAQPAPATAPVAIALPKPTPTVATEPTDKKLSALDAAAKLLGEKGQAMNCVELIQGMAAKGYWSSPGGKTPESTLYAALMREIKLKGAAARFVRSERGKFALVG